MMERKSAMRRRNSAPKNTNQQMESGNTNQDNPQASNSEIIQLLQQVNEQLSKIEPSNNQNSTQSSNNPNSDSQIDNTDSNNTQANNSETNNNKQKTSITSELEKLFKKALTGKQTQASANNNNQNQQVEQEKSSKQITGIAAQTAVQVLAQTQYELANELEVSLKKLKQVISESEQVAQKIANLLGEESRQ